MLPGGPGACGRGARQRVVGRVFEGVEVLHVVSAHKAAVRMVPTPPNAVPYLIQRPRTHRPRK